MRDEDLREEFAAWLRPVREAEPPALPVIRRRLRRRRIRLAAGATAALAAVAGLAVTVNATLGAPRPPDSSFSPSLPSNIPVTTSGPHPVPGGYQVSSAYTVSSPVSSLEVYGGNITVTGSQRSTVSVSERVTWFGSGSRPAMVRNLTGKKVTLEYGCSGDPLCAVSYDIQVPRGLKVLVDSDRGAIRLSSLAGSVVATTNFGPITADGLSSRDAAFVSPSGRINAVFTAVPMTVRAASAGGDITIRVPGTVSYQVNIRPGNGKATVSVRQSFSSRHVIDASSNEGNVVVAPSP
jgi:Putative adhesin